MIVRKRIKAPAKLPAKPPRKAKASPVKSPVKAKVVKAKAKASPKTIVLLVEANPRKEGSAGAAHFDAMRGRITVAEYAAKFPGKENNARQWLKNTIKDGFAEVK